MDPTDLIPITAAAREADTTWSTLDYHAACGRLTVYDSTVGPRRRLVSRAAVEVLREQGWLTKRPRRAARPDAGRTLLAELAALREGAETMRRILTLEGESPHGRAPAGKSAGLGHSHADGIHWDSDNVEGLRGTECVWCRSWREARAALSRLDALKAGT